MGNAPPPYLPADLEQLYGQSDDAHLGELDGRQERIRSCAAAGVGLCGLPEQPVPRHSPIPHSCASRTASTRRSCTSWSTRQRIHSCWGSDWPQRATSCRSSAVPRQMPPARQTRSQAWFRMRLPSGTRSLATSSRRSFTSVSIRTSRSTSCGTACFRALPRGRRRSTFDSRCRAAPARCTSLAASRSSGGAGIRTRSAGEHAASLLDRCAASHTCPKVIEAFGASEFWGLRMSPGLIGTDAAHDIPLPENVRRYYYPGTTHGGGRGGFQVDAAPTGFGGCTLAANPNPEADTTRALTAALIEWVVKGTPPPPSRYPRLDRGELVAATKAALGFPDLPGLSFKDSPVNPVLDYDFGPLFVANDMTGVISLQPPRIRRVIPTYVPKVNADGNETAGVPSVLHQAPLGTYLGWNLTAGGFFAGQGCGFAGGYVAFAKTTSGEGVHSRSAPLGRGALWHARGIRLRRRARRQAGRRRAISVERRRRSVDPRGPSERRASGGGGEH